MSVQFQFARSECAPIMDVHLAFQMSISCCVFPVMSFPGFVLAPVPVSVSDDISVVSSSRQFASVPFVP